METRAHVYISGRVQGVFFRVSMRDMAFKLGLVGWVKNLPDGRVESVFEGDATKTQELIAWCYKGPKFAQVSDVNVDLDNATGEFTSFDMIY